MKNIYIVFFSVFLSCCCVTWLPAQKKLNPTDDTYVYSDGTIRGMENTFKTYHSTAGTQFRRVSFLKFDISTLSPFIESAKLRLYTNGFTAGGDNAHQFDLYPVQINSWAEDDISFTNYKSKVGEDVNTLLASYAVTAGEALPAQYIELTGSKLAQMIADSVAVGKRYISFRLREKNVVKNGNNGVIVEFHSKEHESGFAPELVIEERDTETYKASDIQVNGITPDDFSEEKYYYIVRLPWDATEIPTVSATAKYQEAVVSVKQATSLTGNEEARMAVITITNGEASINYSVLFELLPPPTDAGLSNIVVGENDLEFFNIDQFTYTVYLPYNETEVPQVNAETNDPNASKQITQASKIGISDDETDRTATIVVKSANNEVEQTYTVVFEQLPELDIFLAIGQSNMAGRAPFSSLMEPMNNVFLLTPQGGVEVASNPMNKYSNIRKDLSVQGLGPSYSCALKVQQHVDKKIAFVVNAQGGSSILTWYQPGKSNYDATLKRAKEAQKYGKIKAIVWHQGESDKGSAAADDYVKYKSDLAALVNNLRTDLNEPELYFVCGELSQLEDRKEFNEEVIQKVASFITNADYVSTEGTSLLADGIHFDAASAILLGERYADKLIDKLYPGTVSEKQTHAHNPLIIVVNNGFRVHNINRETGYVVSDISGRQLGRGIFMENSYVTLNKGFYLVSLYQEQYVNTYKIFVP